MFLVYELCGYVYSGTPLNGHPSTTAICDIMDNSEVYVQSLF